MVTLGNRRYGNPVLVQPDGSITKPRRIPFTEKAFEEGWLQELIRAHPELLPVTEIEPAFAPLVSVGREVTTKVGSIDNLYLSPQGYLTIVETKLWRNPEARRQVVGQIIDYAKEVSRWSYEDLENRVRAYNQRFRGSNLGIFDTLQLVEPMEETDEQAIVDIISRNLKQGRFLLLVVGDGIHESVEAMADFLNQTPQLYFTLALVEFQVYELGEDKDKSLLVIPQIVARTKEITRAIVRVEGKAEGIIVDIPPEPEKPMRTTISEEDFFDVLSQNVKPELVNFARQIIEDVENLGCRVEWKQASYVVKIPDPAGSGELFTLFAVDKNGKVWTHSEWLPGQLQRIFAIPKAKKIAMNFLGQFATLSPTYGRRNKQKLSPDSRGELIVLLSEFRQNYKMLCSIVESTIDKLRQLSEEL